MRSHFLNSAKKIVEYSVTFTIAENVRCVFPFSYPNPLSQSIRLLLALSPQVLNAFRNCSV